MASLATIATVATIGAAVVGTGSAIYGGIQSQRAMDQAAAQEELAGKNEFAAAQRSAQERRLEGALISSRQQAIAAASGAGASDDAPTITKIMSETAARTQYGVDTDMYGGQQRRDDYNNSASARRETGRYNFFGGILSGVGRGLSGAADYATLPT